MKARKGKPARISGRRHRAAEATYLLYRILFNEEARKRSSSKPNGYSLANRTARWAARRTEDADGPALSHAQDGRSPGVPRLLSRPGLPARIADRPSLA